MRRVVLLAGGALLAGAGLFVSRGASGTPAASIEGAALAPKAADPAGPAITAKPADPKAEAKAAAASDGALQLQLDKLQLVDGHYQAPLADGRMATLTLDPELQQLAEQLLDQSRAPRGAIVAMTPDGKLLAFAGRRTEEPKGGTEGQRDFSLVTSV
jgi:hypothetical protein